MSVVIDGTSGVTTPGVVNTAGETIATTLAVTGASTLTGAVTASTTLAVTGVSTFAAGTALLPALTTTGDTNTGVWFPAADTIAASTGGTEQMRIDSAGLLKFNSGYGSAATAYGCRAWVNFDGTLASPITPRASGNISSITKSVSTFTISFTNTMVDANYAVNASGGELYYGFKGNVQTFLTTSFQLATYANTVAQTTSVNCLSVFR